MAKWRGKEQVLRNMRDYERRIAQTANQFALYWEVVLETDAKRNAPWTDRTANARESLYTSIDHNRKRTIIYLSHGMEYGLFLEVANAGRYAILWDTIEANLPAMRKMLKATFDKS